MINKYDIEWISSTDPKNQFKLDQLAKKMGDYYTNNTAYYGDIEDSETLWVDKNYLPHQKILEKAKKAENILEIGCGESPILKFYPELSSKYTGIDFSPKIIANNRKRFPKATYSEIDDPYAYPFQDKQFDLIFSVFVLEHTVFPQKFLNECMRLVKPGGEIVILAPSYLDYGVLTSQQVSEDLSSGRELLKKGDLIGTIRAALYNKFLIPNKCKKLSNNLPGFYINLNPLCFRVPKFQSDVDAVYVVSEREIEMYFNSKGLQKIKNPDSLDQFVRSRKLCFQIYKKEV